MYIQIEKNHIDIMLFPGLLVLYLGEGHLLMFEMNSYGFWIS